MEDIVAEVTVRVVLPEIAAVEVAVMVAVPATTAVARPLLSIVATDVFEEFQVTCVVISWVDPSEKVPAAANCWVNSMGTLGLAGVTAMEERVAEFTVSVVLPEIAVVEVAVMVAVPATTAVARPLLLTVATEVSDEFQVTCVVISWVDPSEKVSAAANCWVTPPGILGLAGVTDMDDKVATVRVALPEIVPEVAVMVAVPAATAVARPLLLTVAIAVSDEFQVTWVVIS